MKNGRNLVLKWLQVVRTPYKDDEGDNFKAWSIFDKRFYYGKNFNRPDRVLIKDNKKNRIA